MKKLKIAVIGSGISGLSAAWLLAKRHDVTLFEAEARLGGHSNTVDCRSGASTVAIDTGFIVYNCATYPNLTALFDYLEVPTAAAQMSFGVSLDEGRYEYAGGSLPQLLGNFGNLADFGHWRMLRDIARFFRTAANSMNIDEQTTLGEFAAAQGYSREFLDRHLLPMAGAIWSAEPQRMLDFSARQFISFFHNHDLLKFTGRAQWRTVVGGAREYVSRLAADSPLQVRSGNAVRVVTRLPGAVMIGGEAFDHIVIATHADQALRLLGDATKDEARILSAFRYSRNRAVLHRDASLMPRRRRLWSSWNHVSSASVSSRTVTYWMNALQPLNTDTDFFVSLNPHQEPDLVEREFNYEHPILTSETAPMQRRLWDLQGQRRTWFCGAYFGAGFHEDGLQAGLAVAEQLGGVLRPWVVADPSGRIHAGAPVKTDRSAQLEAAA